MLGRPLGVPGDAVFQRAVLMAALKLLEAASGPVLEDYPVEAPMDAPTDATSGEADNSGFACPVNFARGGDDFSIGAALQREIAELLPWHSEAVRRRGRTTATLSGFEPLALAAFIASVIASPDTASANNDRDVATTIRLACEDMKAFYLEAVTAQPGARAAQAARDWFWHETSGGKALFAVRDALLGSSNLDLQRYGGKGLVPLAVAPRPAQWVYEAKWKT